MQVCVSALVILGVYERIFVNVLTNMQSPKMDGTDNGRK